MKKKLIQITPFANESESFGIGDLTVENRIDRITIYGNIDITRDKEGFQNAEILQALFNDIVASMNAETLPDKISIKPADHVPNPFGG